METLPRTGQFSKILVDPKNLQISACEKRRRYRIPEIEKTEVYDISNFKEVFYLQMLIRVYLFAATPVISGSRPC